MAGVTEARASVLTEYGAPFTVRTFPVPEPEPGALVVDIDVATVCGSDVHVWLGHLAGRLPISPPLILGHEMAGTVTAIGAGADTDSLGNAVRVGDRVVWAHAPCGRCHQCTVEREPTQCRARYIGYLNDCGKPPHFTGTFADVGYVIPRAGRLVIPDGVTSPWAAAASCALRTVVRALDVAGPVATTDRIVIQGAGPLGLFATALLSLHSPAKLVVVGGPADRLAVAAEWGASDTVSVDEHPDATSRVEIIRELTGGPSLAFELAGAPGAFAEGIDMLAPNGRYVAMGTLGGERQPVDAASIVLKALRIRGSMSGDIGDYHTALELLDRFRDRFRWDRMIGTHYGLDQLDQAMNSMLAMEQIKPVIQPNLT
jgi:threonine dehydrogenase-like Zn-dependent dehydrogenase